MDQHQWHADDSPERVILVGVEGRFRRSWDVHDSLNELAQLSSTSGAEVAESMIVKQHTPNPSTYIGKGKCEEIAEHVKSAKAGTVVFDDDLTPAQGRNVEKIVDAKVIDRTQMILDIFAQHARTREGRLQIELAQLEYLLPRLRHMWTHLERQKGGIGLRGPGEKQLEMDRRRIQMRISKMKDEIEQVRSRRSEQRRGRKRHGWALLSLVGYTNAGKSTLFNAMTGAKVLAYDQLFATLDPTTRKIALPNNQQALISDTVGFIRKLPHHLVDSFKATLEEVVEADVLLHVIDGSHEKVEEQIEAVEAVLRELGADAKPTIHVINKMDIKAAQSQEKKLLFSMPHAVSVSAITGEGVEDLLDEVADRLRKRNVTVSLRIPVKEGKLLAEIRKVGTIYSEDYVDSQVVVRANIPGPLRGAWASYVVEDDQASA